MHNSLQFVKARTLKLALGRDTNGIQRFEFHTEQDPLKRYQTTIDVDASTIRLPLSGATKGRYLRKVLA